MLLDVFLTGIFFTREWQNIYRSHVVSFHWLADETSWYAAPVCLRDDVGSMMRNQEFASRKKKEYDKTKHLMKNPP